MKVKAFAQRSSLFASSIVLATSIALGVVPSAQAATNVIPNADFETAPCGNGGSIICGWSELVGSMTWDATDRHGLSGHTMQLTGVPNPEATTISNICIQIGAGMHSASFWYRTADANVNQVALGANFYANSTCSVVSIGIPSVHTLTPTTDGNWHQVTGTLDFPPTTGSALFDLFASCNACGSITVNFDDIDVESEVLAATLASFRAVRSQKGVVVVRWRTGTEVDELGFNVYRQVGARRLRLNKRVLPALGSMSGASYSYLDRFAPRHRALRYWLQDVDVRGNRTWHGPVRVPAA